MPEPAATIRKSIETPSEHRDLPVSAALAPLDMTALISTFPGPAAVTDGHGVCLASNESGAMLADVLADPEGEAFKQLIVQCITQGRASQQKLSLDNGGEVLVVDMTILPLASNDSANAASHPLSLSRAVVLAHDVSHEHKLSSALVASRQLFRDLVECSADFAWETDQDGLFTYVSPNGVLGFSAGELAGRDPVDTLTVSRTQSAAFSTRQRIDNAEIWVIDAQGRDACLEVAAVPVFRDNEWIGSRGVCRDMTEARQYETALAQAYEREHVIAEIVDAIRVEGDSAEMLNTAARRSGTTLKADYCWIKRVVHDGDMVRAAHWCANDNEDDSAKSDVHVESLLRGWNANQGGEAIELCHGDKSILVGPCRVGEKLNGAICLVRKEGDEPWSSTDRALLEGVARQLGIALTQIGHREELERLSRTDELTGLLNRRAFEPIVHRRMAQANRHDRVCGLLYLDLDNFKQVNDQLGHHVGDELLTRFAESLQDDSRLGDRAARLGGDEFALWLDETDQEGAVIKAEHVIDNLKRFWHDQYSDGPFVGVSIGIAVTNPAEPETFEQFINRADQAMYQAKRLGKMRWALAPSPALTTDLPCAEERGVDEC